MHIEMPNEFDKRHGGDCVRVNSMLLYSNGAMIDAVYGGQREEPPTDRTRLLERKRKYYQVKLSRAEQQFLNQRQMLHDMSLAASRGAGLMGAAPADIEALRQMKLGILKLREQLLNIELELQNTPEAEELRQLEGRQQSRHEQYSPMLQELRKLTLDGDDDGPLSPEQQEIRDLQQAMREKIQRSNHEINHKLAQQLGLAPKPEYT